MTFYSTSEYKNIDLSYGIKKMQQSSVAICGLVRDCGYRLECNIPLVEKLREFFKKSYVVIVENDSVDNTKIILNKWHLEGKNINIISEDYGNQTIPDKIKGTTILPAFSRHRIEKMVLYRNKYLNYVKKYLVVDYVIIIDLDIFSFSINGIVHSFSQICEWDCISSNGRNLIAEYSFRDIFYDTYAFRELNDKKKQTIKMIRNYHLLKLPVNKLLKVRSGFNGLAIYRFKAIQNIQYECKDNNDSEIEAECEHVTFHQKMIDSGYDKIFINPFQITQYQNINKVGIFINIFSSLIFLIYKIYFVRWMYRKIRSYYRNIFKDKVLHRSFYKKL
jgi:hypothetical protein